MMNPGTKMGRRRRILSFLITARRQETLIPDADPSNAVDNRKTYGLLLPERNYVKVSAKECR